MRFMTMVSGSENAGVPPAEMFTAVEEFAAEATKQGVLVIRGGLFPSSAGARVRVAKGRIKVTDGPFSEAKEVVGGWAILRVNSRAEALENARQFMELHSKHWPGWEGTSEVFEMEEYG